MSAGSDGMSIKVERLSTGYIRAQGDGPCEWAQWPEHHYPQPQDFFGDSSDATAKRNEVTAPKLCNCPPISSLLSCIQRSKKLG
jgi:hypothetical protein